MEDYRGDVLYDVWMSGGNPDMVDFDRIKDYQNEGLYPEEAAQKEMNIQRKRARPTEPGEGELI